MKIKPFNIIDRTELPEVTTENFPVAGDPLEIENEMYYVCETNCQDQDGLKKITVIPLVIKDPGRVENIESYKSYLSIAIRRMQNRKAGINL